MGGASWIITWKIQICRSCQSYPRFPESLCTVLMSVLTACLPPLDVKTKVKTRKVHTLSTKHRKTGKHILNKISLHNWQKFWVEAIGHDISGNLWDHSLLNDPTGKQKKNQYLMKGQHFMDWLPPNYTFQKPFFFWTLQPFYF